MRLAAPNRTKLELKRNIGAGWCEEPFAPNRTKLELKPRNPAAWPLRAISQSHQAGIET